MTDVLELHSSTYDKVICDKAGIAETRTKPATGKYTKAASVCWCVQDSVYSVRSSG